MQFLFPGFLWALLALAVPVILHLFYFRRYKKVYFSNVRFLREVKEETSARNKLRNLLILIMRCLALAFLVLAFAQPFIPVDDTAYQGQKNVSIFIDNSFSMQSFGQELPLMDRARQRAREIVEAYGEEDQFQILTHEMTPGQQRLISREEALAQIEEIDITARVTPLSRVLERQSRLFRTDPDARGISYLISDFQRSISEFGDIDTAVQVNLVPIQSVQEKNVAIDTAWLAEPAQVLNQTSQLIIRLSNYSADDLENIKLTTIVNGQEKPLGALNIPAGESVLDTANITILTTGWHEVTVRITDFPVQFDDTYFMTFYVDEDIRILSINQSSANRRLEAAFANNPHFQLVNQEVSRLNFSEMRTYDLIILNEITSITSGLSEELYGYIEGGGKVLFFPAEDEPVSAYQTFLSRHNANAFEAYQETERLVGYVNTEEFLFRDVYEGTQRNIRLPATRGNYTQSTVQGRGAETILGYRDGSPFLSKYQIGRGMLLVC
ncbi:MAG: BatA domain-containing protein, partial [Saprospiraceae bacterium]|nr:BatA domain-containing protein [Saprospiraceae bacterium]